ncbi:uncharacterized protein LOC119192604 [Manduca sexta]|uniref:uncharacterized protein LOC119192604 n=1 Tax=Manduca sexta TaxID=7130 RepID=UPI00188E5B6C|nr:uncharacterized protein LOC119192604 [Manduca sexta]
MDALSCDLYNMELVELVENIESMELMSSQHDEELYELCDKMEQTQVETTIQKGDGSRKRSASTLLSGEEIKRKKKLHLVAPSTLSSSTNNTVSTEFDDKIECPQCQVHVLKKYLTNHVKSNTHKNNVIRRDNDFSNVQLIDSAFGNRLVTYRVKSNFISDHLFETPELFLKNITSVMYKLLERSILEHSVVKVNFILNANFIQETKIYVILLTFRYLIIFLSRG